MEVLDERLGAFRVEVLVIVGTPTLSLCEYRACGALAFDRERDPVASRRWLEVMANSFRVSFCPRRRTSGMLPAY